MTDTRVKYKLASSAHYKCNIVRMGRHEYDALAYQYKQDFPDIELTRFGEHSDMQWLHTKCLITINGYVYPTVLSDNRLYVPQATHSMLRSRSNATGILDFSKFAPAMTKHPITSSMVTEELNSLAYDKVIITFDEEIIQPLLIVAGYLIPHNEEYFYRVSDRAFALRLSKLQYMEKLYELNRYRDIFKDLGLEVSPTNAQMVDTQQARSIATVRKLLTLGNSFMVDLHIPNVHISRSYLEHSRVPGSFATELAPTLPLITGYGKLCEYSYDRMNHPKWHVTTQDWHYNNHLLTHRSAVGTHVYSDSRVPGRTHAISQSFFLNMSQTPYTP